MMKHWVIVAIVSVSPIWLAAENGFAAELKMASAGAAPVVVRTIGNNTQFIAPTGSSSWHASPTGGHHMIASDEVGTPYAFAVVGSGGDVDRDSAGSHVQHIVMQTDEDGEGKEHSLRIVQRVTDKEFSDRGWLGVSIGTVSATVADQLDLNEQGILIVNVAKESPAEAAGIEAHDILLSINGQQVSADVGEAVELVAAHKPGEAIEVVLLRDGEEVPVTVELAERPNVSKFRWKFDTAPLAEIEETVTTLGHMLQRDDDGNWTVRSLGDLEESVPGIVKLMPFGNSHTAQVWVDGDRRVVEIQREEDGEVLNIEQEGEGEITVTRVDENGEETVDTYATEEELAEADEEAAELYRRSGKPIAVQLKLDGDASFSTDFEFDFDNLEDNLFEWHADLEAQLEDAAGAYETAMEKAREAYEKFAEQYGDPDHDGRSEPHYRLPFGRFIPRSGLDNLFFGHVGKPKHTFDVNQQGQIEVRIRKGDSELVRVFEDADDLAYRNPALYEKYEALMQLDEDQ